MSPDEALQKIAELVARDGELKIKVALINASLGVSTAEKLARGDYRVGSFRRITLRRLSAFFEEYSRESA